MRPARQIRASFGLFGLGLVGLLGVIVFYLPRYSEPDVPVLFDLLGVRLLFGYDLAVVGPPLFAASVGLTAISFVAGGALLKRAYDRQQVEVD